MTAGDAEDANADPVFDRKQMAMLGALAPSGEAGGLTDLVSTFLTEAQATVVEASAATAVGDAPAVAYAAHNLRGAALMFGARRVAAVAAVLEQAAQEGRLDSVPPLVTRVQGELADFAAALEELGGDPPSPEP